MKDKLNIQTYIDNHNIFFQRYKDNVVAVDNIVSFIDPNYILEIGCGSGNTANTLTKFGYSVHAVDGSPKMIEDSKKLYIGNKELSFAVETLPLLNGVKGKFGGCYSIATLMHLEEADINLALSRIWDLLEHEGQFVCSVSLSRDDVDDEGYDQYGRFFSCLTEEKWMKMLKENGFNVKMVSHNSDIFNRGGIDWVTFNCIKI